MKKKVVALFLVVCLCVSTFSACGGEKKEEEKDAKVTINIAYQYGMAYAPVIVMKEKKLIEKYCDNVEINWQVLNSGSAINEGVIAGDIQVAYMGVAPFITAVMKGTPYKLYGGCSTQPMGMMTNDSSIETLADFKGDDKIALVNVGSIQHIALAMAAKKELGDPNAMDDFISPMAHPDGMQALLSGAVKGHLTSAPYLLQEFEDENLHEIPSVREACPNNVIIGTATQDLYDNKPVYDALVSATQEAMDFLNDNPEEAAQLLYENEGLTLEKMTEYLKRDDVDYSLKATTVMSFATFMEEAAFIDKAPASLSEIAYDNVEE